MRLYEVTTPRDDDMPPLPPAYFEHKKDATEKAIGRAKLGRTSSVSIVALSRLSRSTVAALLNYGVSGIPMIQREHLADYRPHGEGVDGVHHQVEVRPATPRLVTV